jgi:pimeloyl-ACP methyl ester carboxylesterase
VARNGWSMARASTVTRSVALVMLLLLVQACTTSATQEMPSAGSLGKSTAPAPSGSAGPLAEYYGQALRWSDCGGGFDCTTVRVPLDYANPSGSTIDLAVTRLTDGHPRGSLLVNPGGPGASGVEFAQVAANVFSPAVLAAYDVVGFDPRGVARSEPVECATDQQLDEFLAVDWTPDSPAEEVDLGSVAAQLGAGCDRKTPGIAAHMSTVEAARDMDVVRAVLGDEKLNYLGLSYGTRLGATYAELFPARVGRMVLDGAWPTSLTLDQFVDGQAQAYDLSLSRFVADCLKLVSCPVSGSVDSGVQQIREFLARLDARPIPTGQQRELNEALATAAIYSALYFPPSSWKQLRTALNAAFSDNGEPLLAILDQAIGRDHYSGVYADNYVEATFGVLCLDSPASGGVAHAQQLARKLTLRAPVFGAYRGWNTITCWHWPARAAPTNPPEPSHAVSSNPIIVLSTKYDPATPYQWGVQLAQELDSATLLTYDGDGHTAYRRGSACVDSAVDAYLTDGAMPAAGTVCEPDR